MYVDRPQRRWRFAELVVTSRRMLQTRPAVFRASLLSQAPGALPRFPHAATRTHEHGPPRGATPPICLPATRSRHGRMGHRPAAFSRGRRRLRVQTRQPGHLSARRASSTTARAPRTPARAAASPPRRGRCRCNYNLASLVLFLNLLISFGRASPTPIYSQNKTKEIVRWR